MWYYFRMDRQSNKFPLPKSIKSIKDYNVSRYPAGDASDVKCISSDGTVTIVNARTRKVMEEGVEA